MKLAAMQRPHAPPVPPRPSRQVVAEALKRTAKLPYPTRQAPPPPNTQPWRPNNKSNTPSKGRTVVYESVKDVKQLIHGCGNSNNAPTKPVVVKTQQECPSKSERTIKTTATLVENRRERQQQQQYQDQQQPVAQVNSENNSENIPPFCERIASICYPIANVDNTTTTSTASRKDGVTSECDLPAARTPDKNDIHVEEFDIKNDRVIIDDQVVTQHKIKSEVVDNNTPTKLLTKIKSNDFMTKCENIFKAATGKLSVTQTIPLAATAITNDNCATVVVVEKSERKLPINTDNKDNIQHQDWLEAGIRYSSTKITLSGDDLMTDVANEEQNYARNEIKSRGHVDFSSICQRIAMSSLQGLPPLPRSLSGFNLNETRSEPPPPPPARSSSKIAKGGKNVQPSASRPSPSGRQLTTLDTQLAILRKEMFGLRQLDLSLLSQLWSLNESIQEFRQLLQDQEDRAPSPSPSSEEGDDVSYINHPPAPPRRPGSLHHHHHHHHHRPPRPPRPLRPLPSDESPSSEEYGAV